LFTGGVHVNIEIDAITSLESPQAQEWGGGGMVFSRLSFLSYVRKQPVCFQIASDLTRLERGWVSAKEPGRAFQLNSMLHGRLSMRS
jgi:hypothetical protein